MIKINKPRVISLITLDTDFTKDVVDKVIVSFVSNITTLLKNKHSVDIYKLGTFTLKEIHPKLRTPNKYRVIKYTVEFKPSSFLLNSINGKDSNIIDL